MWKIIFSLCGLLALCSCQYSWNEGLGNLHGEYSVGKIRNLSDYSTAGTTLEQKLVDGLRRQSKVTFGSKADYGTMIEGTITKVEKVDLEQDELGRPKEWQFIVFLELKCTAARGTPQNVTLTNRDTVRSSGIYRPLANNSANDYAQQTVREDEALAQALDDLVHRIMLYLATHPQ